MAQLIINVSGKDRQDLNKQLRNIISLVKDGQSFEDCLVEGESGFRMELKNEELPEFEKEVA